MEKKAFNILFGNALKLEREKRSISQSELARMCFKDRQYIHLLEKGSVTPTIFTVYLICKELDINVSVLIPQE